LALLDRAIVKLLPVVPRQAVRRLSTRYIAGPELSDATRVVDELNAGGKLATIDVLGEEVLDRAAASRLVDAYQEVLAGLERSGLDSHVSVKPTALGLKLDLELCRENLAAVVDDAAAGGNFVRIDTEDSSTTSDTLRLYRELRESGRENVGVVLQSYLRRTVADAARSPTSSRTCGSARASTPSRPSSPSPISTRCGRASSRRSTPCSTPMRTSGSRRTTSG
jgi:proline dehydrogenase